MSLRKSPTLTPGLLESQRRNAQKSTGPRTARGKAWVRLNHLRHGAHSSEYRSFVEALLNAPPGRVGVTAQALLASKLAPHPMFREIAEISIQAEIELCQEHRLRRAASKWKKTF
jgi:hypothetical protein